MTKLTELDIEQVTIEMLQGRGYEYLYDPDIAPDRQSPMRTTLNEVVLREKLEAAVRRLNPSLPAAVLDEAVKTVLRIGPTDLLADNEQFHELLTQGEERARRCGWWTSTSRGTTTSRWATSSPWWRTATTCGPTWYCWSTACR